MFSLLTLTRSIYISLFIAKVMKEKIKQWNTHETEKLFFIPFITFLPIIIIFSLSFFYFINIAVLFICAHKKSLRGDSMCIAKKLKSFYQVSMMKYFEHIIIIFMPKLKTFVLPLFIPYGEGVYYSILIFLGFSSSTLIVSLFLANYR